MSIDNGCEHYKNCDTCDYKDCRVNKQKEEIKHLKEELASKLNAVIAFQEIANENRLKIWEERKAKAELQMQVDELKSELIFWESHKVDLIDNAYQQAVKNTAKKIEDKINNLLDTPFEGKTEKQKWQRKGMEEGLKMMLEIVRLCKGVEV